ncbi:MAG: CoA transferase [Sphingomonadaceae bacterium]|uniref:CaiB/BaiF CoA transferase family protein n=1 Tax=Thermaurantiacus sp. TaxID=2820283 RepID=UPI00298F343F|nr:CoA transferase [Thermaurantiacus sp.]MCS6985940.1 CoA transferase [Sphingomonadaceae bacterium]MDW8414844.1 CoA transferase [Thermaurantiacus sp.]
MNLPLSGIRILSVESYGAGPYGTLCLAQLGAEVIKLEPPAGGDSSRQTGPFFLGPDDSLFFQTFNLNKRSLTLDLKTAEGQRILHRLVMTADAVTNNARGDQPAKLGLDYRSLGAIKPSIVCVHASAYGRGNERESWPGYDYLMQAEAGFLSLTGEPDAPPTRFGLSMVDYMTGQILATATLAGILAARETGRGGDYDVALLEAAVHQTSYPAMWYLNEGYVTGRSPRSAHPSVTPSQLFRTADGWIFVMAQLPKFWERLAEALEAAWLTTDPRFATVEARLKNRPDLTEILDEIFLRRTTAEWLERLRGRCPVAPVHDLAQALENAFIHRRGMIQQVPHPQRPGMRALASPILVGGQRLPARPAPALGADTEAILAEAGFSAEEIAGFRRSGVV